MAQEDFQEELNLRLDEMEDNFITLREFVLQTMDGFRKRITGLEMGHSNDVQGIREDMRRLSDSFTVQPVAQQVQVATSPFQPQTCSTFINPSFCVAPTNIASEFDQLPEGELKESLRPHVPKELDSREKLSKLQLAFVLQWIEHHELAKGGLS